MTTLRIKLLTDTARAPKRAEEGSVGYDIYADLGAPLATLTLYPGERAKVKTGIAVAVPPGCYGRVAPRSGLADRIGVAMLAGVIDPSYRGEVLALPHNTGDEAWTIHHGDRVAQMILEVCVTPDTEIVGELDATERGSGGFGSTGVSA